MQIIEKLVDDIYPYENNPRKNDDAVKYVANSIKEFGFKVPIIIDKDDVVVAGHTRLKAAKSLGLEKVPCIVADDLSEEQVRAFRIADNATAETSWWDYRLLDEEIAEIMTLNMADFGLPDPDYEDIDDMFDESPLEEKEPKTMVCPHCGETIVL